MKKCVESTEFSADGKLLACIPGACELTEYTIPEGVTHIEDFAFYGCESLRSVTIPGSVVSIGSFAFYGCKNLTSITIPNSVRYVGAFAFRGCKNLAFVTAPDSVSSMGDADDRHRQAEPMAHLHAYEEPRDADVEKQGVDVSVVDVPAECGEHKVLGKGSYYCEEKNGGVYYHFIRNRKEYEYKRVFFGECIRMGKPQRCTPWSGGAVPKWMPKSLRYSFVRVHGTWQCGQSIYLASAACRMVWNIYQKRLWNESVACLNVCVGTYILDTLCRSGIVQTGKDETLCVGLPEILETCRSYESLRSELGIEGAYAKQVLLHRPQTYDVAAFERGLQCLSNGGHSDLLIS